VDKGVRAMRKFLRTVFGSLALVAVLAPASVIAQESATDDIEQLFDAEEDKESGEPSAEKADLKDDDVPSPSVQLGDVKELSDLVKLAPFEDVAMIQKRYLPKTKRFEVFGGLTGILNDAFFLAVGAEARLGYYFSERYGIEFPFWILNTSEKEVTSDLRNKRGVFTQSLITAESYYGIDFKWTPVYGKMTWRNKTITPFDLYFSLGGGLTGTNQDTSEPTLHLGTGQIFALSKGMAVRWDFSWNFFMAESTVAATKESSLYNNLFLTIGMSFFFPEATYR
jgi:outer membrane beta-barrel protein